LTPDLKVLLVRAYSGMGKHKEALTLLAKLDKIAGEPETQTQHLLELLKVRELRLDKKPKEASELLKTMIGTNQKKGWGFGNLTVRKEEILVSEDLGDYGKAAVTASSLVRNMSRKVNAENTAKSKFKDEYFECYYHLVFSLNKFAKSLTKNRDRYLKQAAQELIRLEKNFPDFGSTESKERFTKLLNDEPELKTTYDSLKKKK
jgi:hypothetical protein